MKNPLFCLLALGIGLATAPVSTAKADDTTNLAAGPTDSTGGDAQGERGERIRKAFAALDLTDAQKEQIKTIRANTQPGKDRRQQVMAVLTPEQKAKLMQMLQQYKSEKQAGAGAAE